jgi:hypothetical protein
MHNMACKRRAAAQDPKWTAQNLYYSATNGEQQALSSSWNTAAAHTHTSTLLHTLTHTALRHIVDRACLTLYAAHCLVDTRRCGGLQA